MDNNGNMARHTTPEESREIERCMMEVFRQSYLNEPKVIIIEDEGFDDFGYMCECINKLVFVDDAIDYPFKVVTGGDKGLETMALRYAESQADESANISPLTSVIFPLSKGEGRCKRFRDEDMLSVATHLIAFWGGEENDTKFLIDLAKGKGIPVFIFDTIKG